MLRIGIDVRDLKIAKTGARTYLEEILVALPRVAPQHQFLCLEPAYHQGKSPTLRGKIGEHLSFIWWKQIELPRQARRHRCDLVFCTDYAVPLFPPCQAIPVFFDASFWANPEHYNRLWRALMDLLTLPAARKAPVVVTISQFSAAEIAMHTNIPRPRIVVIPIAPKSSTQIKLDQEQIRDVLRTYGLDTGLPIVLHVGVLEKRKNLPRLIEAFAQFLARVERPHRLVLVGQAGPKRNLDDSSAIHSAIQRFDVADRVVLTGHIPDRDLPAFYQGADFLVFPSLREGFGLPILEAFANDLPVLAAQSSAIPEVVGEAALLFDPMDIGAIAQTMLRVATDTDLKQELIQRGRVQGELFSWDRTASRLVDLFEQIHSLSMT
jgi:glycosyltransferase involved in cell wall biosynthesis